MSSTDAEAMGHARAEFIKQANTICDRAVEERSEAIEAATERIDATGRSTSTEAGRKQLADEAIIPENKKMVGELSRLKPPANDSAVIGRILDGLEQGIRKIEASPNIAFEPVVITRADVWAQRYGLPECRV